MSDRFDDEATRLFDDTPRDPDRRMREAAIYDIAAALRQAYADGRDAGIEEAAKCLWDHRMFAADGPNNIFARDAAADIRSLKTKGAKT